MNESIAIDSKYMITKGEYGNQKMPIISKMNYELLISVLALNSIPNHTLRFISRNIFLLYHKFQ